jgi:hypothetical protein
LIRRFLDARRRQKNLPIVVPGWEDATLGNMYAAAVIRGDVKNVHTVRTGIEYMTWLAEFYTRTTKKSTLGMFQIGGGISGDFPICVVPMLHQDLLRTSVPLWGYFCQISDSTTSYGSYSGAVPNEKITWGKLGVKTPKYIIESDATIVAPLIFAHVLGGKMKPNDFSEARVLVTGGAGFIGSALVWALNRRGCDNIVVCDILGTNEKWRNLTPLALRRLRRGRRLAAAVAKRRWGNLTWCCTWARVRPRPKRTRPISSE